MDFNETYRDLNSNNLTDLTENGSDDEFDEFVDFEESEFDSASSLQEQTIPESVIQNSSASNDSILVAPVKLTASSAPVSRSSTPNSLSNISHNNITSYSHNNLSKPKSSTAPEQLDVDLVKSLCSISEETLQTFTDSQILDLKTNLLALSRQASDTLTYWLDQREQTTMDSETYNQMIECLVGHAQKIRDGCGKQSKSSWDGRGIKSRKKATSAVASGL
ncbi:13658_t:CDS:2, partial [Acaulospora colombiana]